MQVSQGRTHATALAVKPKTDGPDDYWSPLAIIQALRTVIAAGSIHLEGHQKWESQGSCNTKDIMSGAEKCPNSLRFSPLFLLFIRLDAADWIPTPKCTRKSRYAK